MLCSVLTMNSVRILHAVRSAITAIAELLVLLLFYHFTFSYRHRSKYIINTVYILQFDICIIHIIGLRCDQFLGF